MVEQIKQLIGKKTRLNELEINFRGHSYTAEVWQDEFAESPREWEPIGTIVAWSNRYSFNETPYSDKDEFLVGMLEEYFPEIADISEWVDNLQNTDLTTGKPIYSEKEIDNMILAKLETKMVITPLYKYEHSCIVLSIDSFGCKWDSGQIGWVYCDKERILKEYGGKYLTRRKRQLALDYIRAEIEAYSNWISGDVYGVTLTGDTFEDDCGGYIMDYYDVCKQAKQELFDSIPIIQSLKRFFPRTDWEEILRLGQQEGIITYEESLQLGSIKQELGGAI